MWTFVNIAATVCVSDDQVCRALSFHVMKKLKVCSPVRRYE